MLAERQQWIHCSVICVLSHLRQKAIVLLRCHVSLRLARRSPAGSISRCRHSVDCGGARLNGYAKEVLVSQSSEKYLVIELGVVMFTLQNNVTFPVCIAPTHRQHCHASAGSSFLTWCLFFFSYLTASWLLLAPTVPGVQPKAPSLAKCNEAGAFLDKAGLCHRKTGRTRRRRRRKSVIFKCCLLFSFSVESVITAAQSGPCRVHYVYSRRTVEFGGS